MTPERLDYFRKLLMDRMDSLLQEAGGDIQALTDHAVNQPDSIDLATYETERDFLLRIADRERRLVLKIREAIGRIEDGSYGECTVCGEYISERRLEVRPVTTHCIDCKTEAEQRERAGSY